MVLSELSLFIPFQNIENKFLGLQYIGALLLGAIVLIGMKYEL